MKKFYILFLIFGISFNITAQKWLKVGDNPSPQSSNYLNYPPRVLYTDTIGNLLYVSNSNNTGRLYTWDKLKFSEIGNGNNSSIHSIKRYKNDIFIGGDFEAIYINSGYLEMNRIAGWNGSDWNDMAGGITGGSNGSYIMAMEEYHNELYVGGHFEKAGNMAVNNIAKWNGSSWSTVGSGIDSSDTYIPTITCMVNFKDELYVAGDFLKAGGISSKNIARWDGSHWQSVGEGIVFEVRSMTVFKNELFITGFSRPAGHYGTLLVDQTVKWDGNTWINICDSIFNGDALEITDMKVFNDELYISGKFSINDSSKNIARFNGTKWVEVSPKGLYYPDDLGIGSGAVTGMAVYDSSLYVGGYFNKADSLKVDYIVRYTDVSPESSFKLIDSSICLENQILGIINTSYNAPTAFEWLLPGATPNYSNEITPEVHYSAPGEYNISLRVSNVNGSDSTSGVIHVYDNPEIPIIERVSDTLLVSSYNTNNQWYMVGSEMANETNDTLIFKNEYNYIQVQYTDSNNCSSISSVFVGVNDIYPEEEVKIYPNPSGNILHIDLINQDKVTLEIIDLNGNILYKNDSFTSSVFDLTNYPCGIYMMKITKDSHQLIKRIIKE